MPAALDEAICVRFDGPAGTSIIVLLRSGGVVFKISYAYPGEGDPQVRFPTLVYSAIQRLARLTGAELSGDDTRTASTVCADDSNST